jgi:hypothetical protein
MGWVVKTTLRSLFPPGKTRYPLHRRLGGPQGRSGWVRKISPTPGFDPRTVQAVASRYTNTHILAYKRNGNTAKECGYAQNGCDITRDNKGEQLGVFNERKDGMYAFCRIESRNS